MIIELQRFLLAAKEGNISRTAEKIFITQSALTQSIQRLEKNLGTKLFVQKGKQIQLTADGHGVVLLGNKIMKLWETAKDPAMRKLTKPQFSIGMFDNAALYISKFIQQTITSETLRLDVIIEPSGKLFDQLRLGILDCAIIVLSKRTLLPKHISLVQTFTEDLVPVASKKFTGNISSIPFILYNKDSNTREQIDAVFREKQIQPKVFAESSSTTFMKELAILGSGVALLPKNYVRSEIAQGILIKQRLPVKWKRTYGVYINELGELDKNHQLVKDIVKELRRVT